MNEGIKSKNNRDRRGPRLPKEKSEYDSQNLDIARVARVTKGGKRFSFRATVVVGDRKERVGVGVAQGRDVAQAIQKATNQGRKHLVTVPLKSGTIPHEIIYKYSSAVVILKPAPMGSGVKAGGPVRVVAKLAGIENLTAKLIRRTNNKINIARATIGALARLKSEARNPTAIPQRGTRTDVPVVAEPSMSKSETKSNDQNSNVRNV